jgi:hypothetical protein
LPRKPFGIGTPCRKSRLVTAHLAKKQKKREDRAHGARGLALSPFFGRPFGHAQRSVAEVGDLFGRKEKNPHRAALSHYQLIREAQTCYGLSNAGAAPNW